MKPKAIILHHSLTKDGDTVNWQAIRKYHKSLGWRDVGYHYGVERINGEVEIIQGRLLNESGAHTKQKGMNRKSIGICFIGNYDIAPPPMDMWLRGLALVKSLIEVIGIDQSQVFGHREFADYKSCPGNLWSLDDFRKELFTFNT